MNCRYEMTLMPGIVGRGRDSYRSHRFCKASAGLMQQLKPE